MTADETIEEIRDRAAAYVLGMLAPEEASAVAARLAAGDPRYTAEVAAFRGVSEDLAHAARPQRPPPGARQRLLAAIAAPPPARLEQGGIRFVFPRHEPWRPGMLPGVEFKVLRADHEAGRVTLLTRLAPGTAYPYHRHDGSEELFLLSGDVTVNGVAMEPGDYCGAAPGSVHDGIRTVGGCTFIVSTSTRDALFA